MSAPPNLIGMLPSELEDLAVELGASRYRGRQLATWIYRKSVYALDAMSDLPKDFRSALSENRTVTLPDVARVTPSQDRSEEHTSELQSHSDLVCRLLLEKKKTRSRGRDARNRR